MTHNYVQTRTLT